MAVSEVRPGVELAWASFGKPDDPAVLLIAGAGAPAAFWPELFCNRLALHGYFVVRYDHRDTGFSTHCDSHYGLNELLLDAVALLDRLDTASAHWVGHSMGGYLAQMAMCNHPERVRTATSISAGSYVGDEMHARFGTTQPSESTWQVLLENQPRGNFEADLPGWMTSWRLLHGSEPIDEDMAASYTCSLYVGDERNAQVADNHVHAMTCVPETLVVNLARAEVSLLVIHGDEDLLVPVDNGRMTAELAGARLIVLPGVGHMFFNASIWHAVESELVAHFADNTIKEKSHD